MLKKCEDCETVELDEFQVAESHEILDSDLWDVCIGCARIRRSAKLRQEGDALHAAIDYGGWNLKPGDPVTAEEIRDYFSEKNFIHMLGPEKIFGPNDYLDCGGYTLEECADAVIEYHQAITDGKNKQ